MNIHGIIIDNIENDQTVLISVEFFLFSFNFVVLKGYIC